VAVFLFCCGSVFILLCAPPSLQFSKFPTAGVQSSAGAAPATANPVSLQFAPPTFVASCADTPLTLLGSLPRAGATFRIICPSQCNATNSSTSAGPVYGCARTNVFGAQTALCRTALHAGLFADATGGAFSVTVLSSSPPLSSYCASAAWSIFTSASIATAVPPIAQPYAISLDALNTPLVATCASTFASVFAENGLSSTPSLALSSLLGATTLRAVVRCPSTCTYSASASFTVLGCPLKNIYDTTSTLCAAAQHSFIDSAVAFQMVGVSSSGAAICNGSYNGISSQYSSSFSSPLAWRFVDAPIMMSAQNSITNFVSFPVGEQVRGYCPPYTLAETIIGCWLQNAYASSSSACSAAVHAGVFSAATGGLFRANVITTPTYFCGGTASNQVQATMNANVPAGQIAFALELPPSTFGMFGIPWNVNAALLISHVFRIFVMLTMSTRTHRYHAVHAGANCLSVSKSICF
jgi:hypothetical protein